MSTASHSPRPGFVLWITGLPASGKSTLAAALLEQMAARGVDVAVLESDALRRILTPHPTYSDEERDVFYAALTHVAKLLSEHGVPVIVDATAHRRAYREAARRQLARFCEVHVDCPLEVCRRRDPKGIYRHAAGGAVGTVPGLQVAYEAPLHPDLVVRGDIESPQSAARRVEGMLVSKGYLPEPDEA